MAIASLFRALHANLFHVDVTGIAPASVGLGMGPMALNPLVRKLRDLTVQAVEASEEKSSSSCNDVHVLPVLVLSSSAAYGQTVGYGTIEQAM